MQIDQSALAGIFPAFPTPFDARGEIDLKRLDTLVDALIAGDAAGVVPVGGTGEYTALSPAERTRVVSATVDAARGRVPVIAGVVSPGYAEALETGKRFADAGADALLLVTPFYVTPTDAGVRAYFERYRAALDIPLLLYDIPARTRYATAPATIAAMAKDDGSIVGMKACNTDLNAFARTVALAGAHMAILSGDDQLYVHHVLLGATGGILTAASLLPRVWSRIHTIAANGDAAIALREHAWLAPLLDALFSESNPGPAKKAFELLGDGLGPVRLPLVAPAPLTVERIRAALHLLPPDWLPGAAR
ncbi:4-hydroxy-tetrahydrodipicolinate synthase [Chitinasiproducens palmae]|uniref:4-hydroxy-tetrahydrodipicolinate synthase n=1 Tax=Chitinasiproducens palmae TaxID=1770053 RepID=A0A1H2PR85_9BURK|nr:4-hydroxy-tetrahydrodipicolinate synthase [Chitinasiproducens palmae]SDV48976.1 4-hydroxy-tetrahydrodipicolinate synthase [Chitinasiproducens palmae]